MAPKSTFSIVLASLVFAALMFGQIVLLGANSSAENEGGTIDTGFETIDVRFELHGREFWACVLRSRLEATQWDANKGEPTTSVGDAFRSGTQALRTVVKNPDAWQCLSVDLKNYGDGNWMWQIEFEDLSSPDYFIAYVYQDGGFAVMGENRAETRARAKHWDPAHDRPLR